MTQVQLLFPCFAAIYTVMADDSDDKSVSSMDEEDMIYPIAFDLEGERCPQFDNQTKLTLVKKEIVQFPKKSTSLPISLQPVFEHNIIPLKKDSGFETVKTQ